jgi:hypothetical protein
MKRDSIVYRNASEHVSGTRTELGVIVRPGHEGGLLTNGRKRRFVQIDVWMGRQVQIAFVVEELRLQQDLSMREDESGMWLRHRFHVGKTLVDRSLIPIEFSREDRPLKDTFAFAFRLIDRHRNESPVLWMGIEKQLHSRWAAYRMLIEFHSILA